MQTILKTATITVLGAAVILAVGGCNGRPAGETTTEAAVEDAIANQQFCPVMTDMAISRNLHVDHEGKRVYFCCPGCIPAFQAEPEKYMEQLHAIHADPEQAAPAEEQGDADHGHHHH